MDEIGINMKNFCEKLKYLPEMDKAMLPCETPGERYIYDLIVKNTITQQDINVGSIDFARFDMEDIESFIERRFTVYCRMLEKTDMVVRRFSEKRARADGKRQYF